jgi:hypothetical protein
MTPEEARKIYRLQKFIIVNVLIALACSLFTLGLTISRTVNSKPTAAPGSHSPSFSPPPSQEPAVSSLEELPAESTPPSLGEGPSEHSNGCLRAPQEAFHSEIVKAFIRQHPNSPLRFVPKDASQDQLRYLEQQTEEIVEGWQKRRDELLSQFGDDLLSFCQDQRVLDNDRERQEKLSNLVRSLWP